MSRLAVHWFLPTGGDDRHLGAGSHGVAIGGGGARRPGHREADLDYLTVLARSVEQLGFDGVLTPTGAHCQDAWLVCAALLPATSRLRFLVALRPGLVEPVLAAQMAATFQGLSGGRLLLNVVVGGDDAEQRGYGDHLAHDERYARAAEFLTVLRRAWTGERFDHAGPSYDVAGGRLQRPPAVVPEVYLGGSSDAGLDVAAEHAEVYLTWGEPPAAVAEKLARVRERAAARGRTVRAGLRVHVITRDTPEQAWADADRLVAGLDPALVARRRAELGRIGSEGQRRMLALQGDDLVVAPNLWAGVGLVRGGAGTALVGSHEQVAERIAEYQDAGVDELVLSGYPHLEEAWAVGEGLLPVLR